MCKVIKRSLSRLMVFLSRNLETMQRAFLLISFSREEERSLRFKPRWWRTQSISYYVPPVFSYFSSWMLSNVTISHTAHQFCIQLKVTNPVRDFTMIHEHGKPSCKTQGSHLSQTNCSLEAHVHPSPSALTMDFTRGTEHHGGVLPFGYSSLRSRERDRKSS